MSAPSHNEPYVAPIVESESHVIPILDIPYMEPNRCHILDIPYFEPYVSPILDTPYDEPYVSSMLDTLYIEPYVPPILDTPYDEPYVALSPMLDTLHFEPYVPPVLDTLYNEHCMSPIMASSNSISSCGVSSIDIDLFDSLSIDDDSSICANHEFDSIFSIPSVCQGK